MSRSPLGLPPPHHRLRGNGVFSPTALWFWLSLIVCSELAQSAEQVTLAWNPNPESDIIGYRLYYGKVSGQYSQSVDAGNTTTFTLTGLSAGTVYYAVVTAYNTFGLESLPSNEISFEANPAETPPIIGFESPDDRSVQFAPATMVLYASAGRADELVEKVEFFEGSTRLGEVADQPWSLIWRDITAGEHVLTAVVSFTDGTSRTSAPLAVTVYERTEEDPKPPTSNVSQLIPIPIQTTHTISGGSEDDSFLVFVSGRDGESVRVQSSHDLIHWSPLATVQIEGGYSYFIDHGAVIEVERRYYRISQD